MKRLMGGVIINDQPIMHIAFCCDDNYLVPARIMLRSFFDTHSGYRVMVHTFSTALSQTSQRKFASLVHQYGARIRFYTIPEEVDEFLKTAPLPTDYISVATYYRLVLPYVVGEKIKKFLYLDGDILVRKDVYKYYAEQKDGVYVSGVLDLQEDYNRKRLGLDQYINAGILVVNVELIRQNFSLRDIMDNVQMLIEKYQENLFGDQDIINIIFSGHIDVLPSTFNYQLVVHKMYALKHPEELREVEIVHFITGDKPWKNTYCFPYGMEYYRYLRQYLPVRDRIKWWMGKPAGMKQIVDKHLKWKQGE